ncbi:helix-hairpin-helix domain-containing protein [Frigoribacterium sp. CFBP 8754]|uniref:ComEA family DNA-binding protein n=1 Tax=Frigoribacterium sp. CFBP 8754 TaxID=2775290 RepID=UPI0017863250|nr:helix-hairpin-helix domain-containing protein [Frigoribacterium sp. CFBP 8754]MBD8659328.1 helix-hairpin-helix domain-containing protein [Frigoribacterium sp. CFBP 8754]
MVVTFRSAPDPARPGGPRWRLGLGAAVVVLLVLAVGSVVATAVATGGGAGGGAGETAITTASSPGGSFDDEAGTAATGAGAGSGTAGSVFVHVHGHVARPGLYEVPAGARVVDVVAAAGGFAEGADEAGVNLARPVVDGEQLRVPGVGEVVDGSGAGGAVGGGASGGGGGAAGGGGASGAGGGAGGGLVDLNRADATALQALPGVGPATSAAIVEWREGSGGFRSVDDLLEVPGIGEKTLESLRPLVTV